MDNAPNDPVTLSLVIPVFRESHNVIVLLEAVRASLEQCNLAYEVVLVDDGSNDDSWSVIIDATKAFSSIRAFRLSRNFGKEAAICAGLERARGDAVILMDADGQHPPSLLPSLVQMWQSSRADIVEAVKRKRGNESLSGKLSALLFYIILNKLSGFDLKGASDYKLMNRKVVNAWLKMEERNVFFRGMTAWMGFTTVQIPFEVVPRAGGQSTWSYLKRLKLALIGITAFSSFPLQLVTFAGVLFFVFSMVLGAETLYQKLTGQAVSGFATVILLQLITGSFLMISLGIIGEYITRIYEEVKGRPRYLITESIESASKPPADE